MTSNIDDMTSNIEKAYSDLMDDFYKILSSMDQALVRESVRDELLWWQTLLMRLHSEDPAHKDELEHRMAAEAFAFSMQRPDADENEPAAAKTVRLLRDKVKKKAKELGIDILTPEEIITASKTRLTLQLEEYIAQLIAEDLDNK